MHEIHHTDEIFLSGEPTPAPEEQSTRFVDVHVYHLPPGEQEPPGVESAPASAPQREQDQEPPARQGTWRFSGRVLVGIIVSSLLVCALALALLLAIQPRPAEATITIVPTEQQITMTSTITLATRQTANAAQVPGRTLAAVTMSQQQTIPTTGTIHQDATAAHGTITFYNAAPFAQTIAAGTLLTGTDGVQVVTDQDAMLPAVAYPTLGYTTVAAHAVIAGPAGNMAGSAIYGPCCRLNVSAVNSAFTGGQVARDYRTVTPQDINTVAASLTKSLMQGEQAALQTQVLSDETLITSLPCQHSITPDHRPGEEAAWVAITVSETCTGMVYNTQAMQSRFQQLVRQQATTQLGEGYALSGPITATVTQATRKTNRTIVVQAHLASMWSYHFTNQQEHRLLTSLAGKSRNAAITILLHTPGIQSVSVSSTILPADIEQIHLLVVDAG